MVASIMNPEGTSDPIRRFFERSECLHVALSDCFPEQSIEIPEDEPEIGLSVASCFLSIEHAGVLRGAFLSGAPNSGTAILRIQYEALLRAAWVLFAASPGHVSKLSVEISIEAQQNAKNLPGTKDMLEAVAKHAPGPIARNLTEFHSLHQHALNSFVHGGIHPLRRTQEGFPITQALQLVAISNALLINAFQMLAAISGSTERAERVRNLHWSFSDCLPELRTSSNGNEAPVP